MTTITPVEKLPLASRKNIRDEYEAQASEITKTISNLLKEPYKVEVDFNLFYAHGVAADNSWIKSSPGAAAINYLESLVSYLKRYTEEGEYTDAIQTFNELVPERRITLQPDENISYSGCRVKDGVFEITYKSGGPGVNVDYACQDLAETLDKALAEKDPHALPTIAKRSIRDDWDKEKDNVTKTVKDELLGADVKLLADYDAIWKTIAEAKKVDSSIDLKSIAHNFGKTIYDYFDGFASQVKYKIKKDDMVVEGFMEATSTGEIWIEVAPQGTSLKNSYHEIEFKDGKFILRTVPGNWGTNSWSVTEGMIDLL